MKAGEITNEELAKELLITVGLDAPFCMCVRCSVVREAARRLRDVTVRADNSAVIAELQRRLKVAEDALDFAWMYADKLPHQWPLPERVRTKMKNALAAIREEGGVNNELENLRTLARRVGNMVNGFFNDEKVPCGDIMHSCPLVKGFKALILKDEEGGES